MPVRMIRPGILSSQRVNALSTEAEIFYRRLMSVVDDFGRFDADLKILTSSCYPLTFDRIPPSSVGAWLTECCQSFSEESRNPLITVYSTNGKKYLQINDFGQRTRTESKFPQPPLPSNVGVAPQKSASRARSSSSTTPHTTERPDVGGPEFDLNEPLEWFKKIFIGEFPADTWRTFGERVNTPELLEKLRANLQLWMRTKKYQNGYGKDAVWFLRSGIWHNPPAAELMSETTVASGDSKTKFDKEGRQLNEAGFPMRIL